jgi:SARP family transcriptional regulator, regulator of embCAB operon
VTVRVSLTERISVSRDGVVVEEQRFPGRQGKLVFVYLATAHARPVPKDELADALWEGEPPARWDKALSVLVSKLRALLNECGVDGAAALTSASGCYALTLPPGSSIDIEAAEEAALAAEQDLEAGRLDRAATNAAAAASLARKRFLPGESLPWVDDVRARLRDVLVRALECLAEAERRSDDLAAAVRAADELVALEPYRERGYRLLMQAQSAAGNDAEALRTYERCRTLLSEELGAYPSAETEALYLEILRGPSTPPPAHDDDAVVAGVQPEPRRRSRRIPAALLTVAVVGGAALAATLLLTGGDTPPPVVLPNSLVRIDPTTLAVTKVVRVGKDPDLVVDSGGFVWVTHEGRRYAESDRLTNNGNRTLWRVDPSTGHTDVVGGGLAPCGLTADPSGDVWVANCYAPGSGQSANVVRVDARTVAFVATRRVRGGPGFIRGMAYGGGSLWVSDLGGAVDTNGITRVDPRAPLTSRTQLDHPAGLVAWADGYGDLWTNDFGGGSVSRVHVATGHVDTFYGVAVSPSAHVVDGDTVWIGDWATPTVVRMPAVGSGARRSISLPVAAPEAGVTSVAAGDGAAWATVPDSHAVWRIDSRTNRVARIGLRYAPWGVAVGDDGVWVAVRRRPD